MPQMAYPLAPLHIADRCKEQQLCDGSSPCRLQPRIFTVKPAQDLVVLIQAVMLPSTAHPPTVSPCKDCMSAARFSSSVRPFWDGCMRSTEPGPSLLWWVLSCLEAELDPGLSATDKAMSNMPSCQREIFPGSTPSRTEPTFHSSEPDLRRQVRPLIPR